MIISKSIQRNSKRLISIAVLVSFIVATTFSFEVKAGDEKIMYPLKEVSKLKCRFEVFSKLGKNCKENLRVLHTKDYKKYIKKDGGYNEYTRLYTVLWGSSYKYGWDVGHGGHSGIDIVTSKGTPVYTIADGVVIGAKKNPSWGDSISISHTIRGKKVISNYAHLSKMNVKKGQKVRRGMKIGEVGSTGNSTGNHLHFQIDLPNLFHPFYYSWKTCPYSYYKITEDGVCFDELNRKTIDPLQFLESEGAILDAVSVNKRDIQKSIKDTKHTKKEKRKKKKRVNKSKKGFDMSIFDKTIHTKLSSSVRDVEQVQKIYKDLKMYTGKIDGVYEKVEGAIIEYQMKNSIITTEDEYGAGWFGPKTRAHTKSSYIKYLKKGKKDKKRKVVEKKEKKKEDTRVITRNKVQKIERKHILSRDEIERMEVENFINKQEVKIKTSKVGENIVVGEKLVVELKMLKKVNKKKRRVFNGSFPVGMTFELDGKIASVFPKKIQRISKGLRNISVKGVAPGKTVLTIKMGKVVLKKIDIKVLGKTEKVYPKNARIFSSKKLVLGAEKTGVILFKDKDGKNLVNLPFGGKFVLDTSDKMEVCIKKGKIKDIQAIYRSACKNSEYKKNPVVMYKDTVGGVLIYDYRVLSLGKAQIKIKGKASNKVYDFGKMVVTSPRGLDAKYNYSKEVIAMLEKGIVTGVKSGYFSEEKELQKKDAVQWIENTLKDMKKESINRDIKEKITKKIVEVRKEKKNLSKNLTRKQFLDLSYKYLVVSEGSKKQSIKYNDVVAGDNKKINTIFDSKNTWKDKFGKTHFQPKKKLTRGEGAYLLSKALKRSESLNVALK